MSKLEKILLEKQVANAAKAEEIINKIDELITEFPSVFKQPPHFQIGWNYQAPAICVDVRVIPDSDILLKTYVVEIPGGNGETVFCAEKIDLPEEEGYKINSLHILRDGGLSELIALEKELQTSQRPVF